MNATPVSGALESLMKLIPGFGGYRDCEQRRKDDRIAREFLAVRLQECKASLDRSLRPLVDRGQLDEISKGEQLRLAIDQQQSRVRAAVEGYSSWFEANKTDATKLSKVAQLDSDLIGVVDRLHSVIQPRDEPIQPGDGSTIDLAQAAKLLELFSQRFDHRRELLQK